MKPLQYIGIGAALVLLLAGAFGLGRISAPNRPVEPLSRDTVVVTHTDTIVREKPVYYAKTVVDTMRIPVTDTLRLRDTLFVDLPREQKEYRDSTYNAWVSGIDPALDSIRVFSNVKCVTVIERVPVEVSRRWGIGVSAGYGASVQEGAVTLSPYIGIGVTYNIITW